ncbi:hypothetical protein KFL_000910290 [Klebsormidium nitens]|uniref:Uncharacterized protein n=1 Tax=Klebsormidium nitens TaxID=105231 RepID=A0A1Y1HT57_KLENI|nr:hypothetical protein KFL_000910290 [Klebsormidium nitens]|eukprot:GAQ81810.1 hypothetical protein KFL_000910290 [Klebsormidium nitens]
MQRPRSILKCFRKNGLSNRDLLFRSRSQIGRINRHHQRPGPSFLDKSKTFSSHPQNRLFPLFGYSGLAAIPGNCQYLQLCAMASVTRSAVLLLALVAMVVSATAARMDPVQDVAASEASPDLEQDALELPGRSQMYGCPKIASSWCQGRTGVCNPNDTAQCKCGSPPWVKKPWEWTMGRLCDAGLKCQVKGQDTVCVPK